MNYIAVNCYYVEKIVFRISLHIFVIEFGFEWN